MNKMKYDGQIALYCIFKIFESGKLTPFKTPGPTHSHSYFLKVVKDWGIAIERIPKNKRHAGSYHHGRKKIYLTTNDRILFYHELAHAGLMKIMCLWSPHYHDVISEIVAQTLYVLAHGKTKNLKKSEEYIDYKCKKLKMIPFEVFGEVKEDVGILLDVILTPNPIFEISVPDKEPMYFKTQLETEIFLRVFKLKDYSIAVVSKDESMDLENDFPVEIVHKKGKNKWEEV